jgi:osmotically-inducible protein OsmY
MNAFTKLMLLPLVLSLSAMTANASDSHRSSSNNTSIAHIAERPDYRILTDAAHALSVDPATASQCIRVDVHQGIVRLTGEVDSYTESMLASRIVEGVRGIRGIRNTLTFRYRAYRTDQQIAVDVKGRIRLNPAIHSDFITVSVKNGMVDLIGIVPTALEMQKAEAEAWCVDGVHIVNSADLLIEPLPGNHREGLPDVFWGISAKEAVGKRIAADPQLARFPIHIDAVDGIVWLAGIVGNYEAQQAAEREAYQVPGVRRVYNNITVRPSANRSDDEIAADIMNALARNPDVDQPGIRVRVVKNEAYISGTVDSIFMKQRVEKLVVQVKGVFQIQNSLTTVGPIEVQPDNEIRAEIGKQLQRNPFIKSNAVHMDVNMGIATLKGIVGDRDALLAAENSAQRGGALVIRNRIIVR